MRVGIVGEVAREVAGQTPSEAMEAQRRKRNELVGERVLGGKADAPAPVEAWRQKFSPIVLPRSASVL